METYLQLFFFGPLHKKRRTVEAKPPSEFRFVDKEKNEFIYHLEYSLNSGHKLVYFCRSPRDP